MKVDYSTFSCLIIDDIVFPDGQSKMNVLGGGLHAVVGMRPWSESVGIAAAIGSDIDEKHLQGLQAFGVDIEGLIVREELQTARAWQIFETNGYRHERLRTDRAIFGEKKIQFEDLPHSYLGAKGYHIQWGTLDQLADLFDKLREASPNCKLVMEFVRPNRDDPLSLWQQIMPQLSLFAPDREEAEAITGVADALQNCCTFIEWGCASCGDAHGSRRIYFDGADRPVLETSCCSNQYR